MYLYFDNQGYLKETITIKPTRQGSSNANSLYVYVDSDAVFSGVWIRFQLPDETITTEIDISDNVVKGKYIPYDKNRDLKYFKYDKPYKMYYYSFPSEILALAGLVLCTVRIVNQDESIFALGTAAFTAEKGVVKEDNNISQSQYDYLIKRVSKFTAAVFTPSIDENGVISWTNKAGLDNPTPTNIKGPKGDIGPIGPIGATGPQGEKGEPGSIYTFEIVDGILRMYYTTSEAPSIYLITQENYQIYGVDSSLIGHLVFAY